MPAAERDLEEDPEPSSSCLGPFSCAPVDEEFGPGLAGPGRFATWRLWRPLLFDNEASDARDHCANERSKGFFSLFFIFMYIFFFFFFSLCLLILPVFRHGSILLARSLPLLPSHHFRSASNYLVSQIFSRPDTRGEPRIREDIVFLIVQ